MPKSDPRIIYWDTKRPLFQYSDIFLNDELHRDLLQILPQDVIQEIYQFSTNERNRIVEASSGKTVILWNAAQLAVLVYVATPMLKFFVL